jgi:phosphoenolpyruvate synthase (EC 2.7.9.2)
LRTGLAKEMEGVRTIPERIRDVLRTRGAQNGREHYVQTLAQGLALFAMAFYGGKLFIVLPTLNPTNTAT